MNDEINEMVHGIDINGIKKTEGIEITLEKEETEKGDENFIQDEKNNLMFEVLKKQLDQVEKDNQKIIGVLEKIENYSNVDEKIKIINNFILAMESLQKKIEDTVNTVNTNLEIAGQEGFNSVKKSFDEYLELIIAIQKKAIDFDDNMMSVLNKEMLEKTREKKEEPAQKKKWVIYFIVGFLFVIVSLIALRIVL